MIGGSWKSASPKMKNMCFYDDDDEYDPLPLPLPLPPLLPLRSRLPTTIDGPAAM